MISTYLHTGADIQDPLILVESCAMILHVGGVNTRHVGFLLVAEFASRERVPSPVPLLRLDEEVPNPACLLSA
jgi:hypothetical protein